jgi:hypothetical protein
MLFKQTGLVFGSSDFAVTKRRQFWFPDIFSNHLSFFLQIIIMVFVLSMAQQQYIFALVYRLFRRKKEGNPRYSGHVCSL